MNNKKLKKTAGIVMAAVMMATSMTMSAASVASAAENVEASTYASVQNFGPTEIKSGYTYIGSFVNRGDAGGTAGVRIWVTSSTLPYNTTFYLGDLNNNIYQGYSTSAGEGKSGFFNSVPNLPVVGIYAYNPIGRSYTISGYYEF